MLKILVCLPIRAGWEPVAQHSCINQRIIFIPDRCVAIITDLIILLVPAVLVWPMGVLDARQKIKTIAMLGAGGIANLVTIVRLGWGVKYLYSKDPTADYVLINTTA